MPPPPPPQRKEPAFQYVTFISIFALNHLIHLTQFNPDAVFRIRIQICKFCKLFGLPDPDPFVRGTDTDLDPSIVKQKYKKNFISTG